MKKLLIPFLILITLASVNVFSLYKINTLSDDNVVFKNFRDEIILNRFLLRKLNGPTYEYELKRIENYPTFKLALYTVSENDDLYSIAQDLYLDIYTIASINSLATEDILKSGDKVLIPNMKGVIYKAEKETEISEIADLYSTKEEIILQINNFHRSTLLKNEEIFIPGAEIPTEERSYFEGKMFADPLKNEKARISSRFGMRTDPFKPGKRSFHGGLDISANHGTPVYATQSGTVIFSGWHGGYGQLIIIEHRYGYKTYYGHLSGRNVKAGDKVVIGEKIGKVGSTGMSTGPHLHFEIRRFDRLKNPEHLAKLKHN